MSNVVPPPPPFAPVPRADHVAWPKRKWLKLPLFAWIAAGVLAVGAIGAAAAPTKETKETAADVPTDSSISLVETVPAATVPTTPLATVGPTTVPTSAAPTVPPTTAPTVPPTAAPTVPPTPAPILPTAAPTVPPTAAPTVPLAAAPRNDCDPNYTPCVPIDSDVDCAGGSGNGPSYVRGPVQVTGSDIYGLDRDGDGIGCE